MSATQFVSRGLVLMLLSTAAAFATAGCSADTGDASGDEDTESSQPGTVAENVVTNTTLYVSPSGSDSSPGTLASPFRTMAKGIKSLGAGSTLIVRGGTYIENVNVSVAKGTPTSPITVIAYPGERPVVQGLLWLSGANSWVLDGINVTWNSANSSTEHMVKMSGGSGWKIQHCEFWGAHSFAALLISGGASNVYVGYNSIHDTYKSNSTNQDHLIYANGVDGGTIERNLFFNSTNGRGIKVGSLVDGQTTPRNLVIRYNTFYNNLGPSNLQFSYSANHNTAYRNILDKSAQTNVTCFNLSGTGNSAADNVGFASSGVVGKCSGLSDGGGNLVADPKFLNASGGDFHTGNSAVAAYGRYAP